MIERASRTVTAERVEPGDLVMRDGKLLAVVTTTIGADAVVLVGKRPGREKGTTRMQVERGADVELVAGDAVLEQLEAVVLQALGDFGRVEHDDRWHLIVDVDDVEWDVPLRDRPQLNESTAGTSLPPKATPAEVESTAGA